MMTYLVAFSLEKISDPRIANGKPDIEKRMIWYPREDMFNPKSFKNTSSHNAKKPGDKDVAIKNSDFITRLLRRNIIKKRKSPTNAPPKDLSRSNNFALEVVSLLS
jgi:hypothetical protein